MSQIYPDFEILRKQEKTPINKKEQELESFIFLFRYKEIDSSIPIQKAEVKENPQKLTPAFNKHGENLYCQEA